MEESADRSAVEIHYQNTLKHIQQRKEQDASKEKFADINLG